MVRPQPPKADPRCSTLLGPTLSPSCALTLQRLSRARKTHRRLEHSQHASTERFPSVSLPVRGGGPGSDTSVRPHRGQGLGSEHCPA